MRKFVNFSNKFFYIIGLIIILILLTMCLLYTPNINIYERTIYARIPILLGLFFIILSLVLFGFIQKFIHSKFYEKYHLIIYLIYFILLVLFVCTFNLIPRADQGYVSNVASQLNNGMTNMFNPGSYMYRYPHQIGIVNYLRIIYSIFGNDNHLMVQIINCCYMLVCVVVFGRISKLLFDEENEKISKIIFIMFIPLAFYVIYVYANIISFMFSLISVYYLLKYFKKEKFLYLIFSFITIFLAYNLKNNALIFLIAEIIMLVLHGCEFKCKSKINRYLIPSISIILFASVYFLNSFVNNYQLEKYNSDYKKMGMPTLSWIALGLDDKEGSAGWYHGGITNYYIQSKSNAEKTKKYSLDIISERLLSFKNSPIEAYQFFYRKTLSQWINPTYQGFWIMKMCYYEHRLDSNVKYPKNIENFLKAEEDSGLIIEYMKIIQVMIIAGTCAYLFFDNKKKTFYTYLPLLIFIGGFMFHLIWEAKGQYTVTYIVLLIPYAIEGYKIILEKSKNYAKEKKSYTLCGNTLLQRGRSFKGNYKKITKKIRNFNKNK